MHHALLAHPASPPPIITGPQTLLFDADDTLWENNIYFERAIAGFVQLAAHPTLSDDEVRQHFNQLEHTRVQLHGYGTSSFRASLLACLQDFRGAPCTPAEHTHIAALVDSIVHADIDLLPDVHQTLEALAARHRLVLVTKGDLAEQLDKLDRSGLRRFFDHAEVVREKHRDAYHDLRTRHRFEAERTWMIGNSPKSDINPALAAGLHAIFLPHANTWVLEHEAIHPAPAGQHLLTLNRFSELLKFF